MTEFVTPLLFIQDLAGEFRPAAEDQIVAEAKRLLELRVRRGVAFDSPQHVKDFLTLRLSALEHEVFVVLFLDAQLRLIECCEMFRGTLFQTSVYAREIVREALKLNAGSVILAHNHPSGIAEPSRADEFLTTTLKTALQLIDVRVLDHLVIGGAAAISFAERGLL